MTNEPWLSVIVPWWKRLAYVREMLESMACQTDQAFECVIVDQGDDSSIDLVHAYKGRFDFRVVYAPHQSDWTSKTNIGFEHARGQYVCMLHTDDVWRRDRVAKLRLAHERHPDAGLLFHAVRYIDPASRALGEWHAPLAAKCLLPSAEVLEHLIIQNFISCPAPAMRRDLIGPGMDATLWYTGDWELYLRVALATSAVYIDEPLADFRLHIGSLTMQRSRSSHDFRRQLEIVLERFENAVPPERRAALLRIARMSNSVNVALADCYHHGRIRSLLELIPIALSLDRADWQRYLKDSRILERTSARLRLARVPLAQRLLLAAYDAWRSESASVNTSVAE